MALLLKSGCERCQAALTPQDTAFICTFECTFCAQCTEALQTICPNCGGELVRRPRPRTA